PCLSDPRLASDEYELPAAVLRLCPRGGERLRLRGTPKHRERRLRSEPRWEWDADDRQRLPRHGTRDDRLGQALQGDRADRREGVPAAPARRQPHEIRGEDLP